MVSKFASETDVEPEDSQAELMKLLKRYGCDERSILDGERLIGCEFRLGGYPIRVKLDLPEQEKVTAYMNPRTARALPNKHAQKVRTRWRLLILVVKSKLELMDQVELPVEEVFFTELLLSNGQTIGERAIPDVKVAMEAGRIPLSILPTYERGTIALGPGGDH